jgi:hypothetical protein
MKNNVVLVIQGKKIELLNDQDIDRLEEKFLKEERGVLELKLKENLENKDSKEF